MIDGILLFVFSALILSITAFVYSNILTGTGEIFGKLYGRLDLFFKTDERAAAGLPIDPIFKLLMQCEKCVAGQWALWSFLIWAWPLYKQGYFIMILVHIGFIGFSIFLTLIVKSLYKKHIESSYGN